MKHVADDFFDVSLPGIKKVWKSKRLWGLFFSSNFIFTSIYLHTYIPSKYMFGLFFVFWFFLLINLRNTNFLNIVWRFPGGLRFIWVLPASVRKPKSWCCSKGILSPRSFFWWYSFLSADCRQSLDDYLDLDA